MAEFASKGVANAGLTTGIIGTTLGVLNGGLNNILGNGMYNNCGNCSDNTLVTRYENGLTQEISAKDGEIALLKSNIYTDQKIADVFERLNTRLVAMDKENCERFASQATYNATLNGTLSCLQGQVAQLQGLTKLIVPITNVCPQPMPQYNSWTAPTAPTTTTPSA